MLALDQRLQAREVVLAGVHGGELRDARLEQPARLEHAGDLAEAQLGLRAQQLAAGRSSEATEVPPLGPRRTLSTPASASTLTASRTVGRLICIAAASSRSEGSRSPSPSSPSRMRSAICSTAPSNVRRGPTGTKPLSTFVV